MRLQTLIVILAAALLGACGAQSPAEEGLSVGGQGPALALDGARWMDERGQSLSAPRFEPRAGGVSVVLFFDPSSTASQRAVESLARLHAQYPDLDVLGVTPSEDEARLAALREQSGATFPVLLGVTPAARSAWGVHELPAVRTIGTDQRLLDRSLMGVLARLEGAVK